jgi:hypothetical protein
MRRRLCLLTVGLCLGAMGVAPVASADDIGCDEDQFVAGAILGDIATFGHTVPCERVYRIVRSVAQRDARVRPGWRCLVVSADRRMQEWRCRRARSEIRFLAFPRLAPAANRGHGAPA